ncbi:MAG: MerR family transcriptional regulator [Desulfobacterales bacterium]|nr:MerR family transcriptional regulator [Desulfobacterales bacterium]
MKDGRPAADNGTPLLKMKELTDATGVAKSTILLYVNKGLLPQPVKTSPNMAYYDPACIERIAFIKKIQNTHRLPLAAIKGLLKEMDRGRDVTPLLELQSTVFGASAEKMTMDQFCRASGLSRAELERLIRLEVIMPVEPALFDEQDLELAKQLKTIMDRGMDAADLKFYPELAREIVAAEINLRETYTRDLGFRENAALTLELTRMARGLRAYVIDRTLQKELIGFKGLHTSPKFRNQKEE